MSSRILLAALRVSLSQAAARMFSAMAEVRCGGVGRVWAEAEVGKKLKKSQHTKDDTHSNSALLLNPLQGILYKTKRNV